MRNAYVTLLLLTSLFVLSGCPATVRIRCECPEPQPKTKPYPNRPEIQQVGEEGERR